MDLLEYREFPLRTVLVYVLLAVPFAFDIYVITGLISGSLFEGTLTLFDHYGLLGYGALAATITLPLSGFLVDRVRRYDHLMYLAALIPSLFGLLSVYSIIPGFSDDYGIVLSTSSFAGLSLMLLAWSMRINQSVVVRFRARTVSIFLTVAIVFSVIFSILGNIGLTLNSSLVVLPAFISLAAIVISIGFRPWRIARAALGISGSSFKYFIPMTLLMAAHLLWFLVTKQNLQDMNLSFVSLSESVNFNPRYLEFVPLVVGVLLSGIISDRMGRKTTFRLAVLLMGLLTIFGSSLYEANILNGLLVSERFVEGILLGLGLFLIWPEIGSVWTRGIRVSMYWFFFLGYMALFWALDINAEVFGIVFVAPEWLPFIGGQVAILLSLIALFLTGPLPTILNREIEMEDLDFGFDERQVKRTVDAFVRADDFASIRSQIDIIDAGTDISDSEMDDILGEEFRDMLPLRRVPGIGASLEKKLIAAGYESAAQLAGESAQRLSQKIDGLSVARAEKLLKDARRVVKKTVKKKK
jgi:hypothetical protein